MALTIQLLMLLLLMDFVLQNCFLGGSQSILLAIHSLGFLLILMPVCIMQWRIETGMFSTRTKLRFPNIISQRTSSPLFFYNLSICLIFILILFEYGRVELNAGPEKWNSCYNFSIYRCNLNSMEVHSFKSWSSLHL